VTDEKFFAWLDGELDPADAAAMERRVAADPELAKLADEHRAFTSRLRAAFEPIVSAPVPEALASAVRSTAAVTDISEWRKRRRLGSMPQWAAIAATLAIGFLGGTLMGPGEAPVETRGGALYASGGLDRALDTQLASTPSGDVRVGLTYRDRSGNICRSFSGSSSSGVACRQGDGWQLRGLFAAPDGQAGDYRMAAGTSPHLSAIVEETIASEPFDPKQEAEAKTRGWR
jgi:hypothetical protein